MGVTKYTAIKYFFSILTFNCLKSLYLNSTYKGQINCVFSFYKQSLVFAMLLDWILEGVLLGIIGVLGIVGNGTASYVFYKRSSGVAGKQWFYQSFI